MSQQSARVPAAPAQAPLRVGLVGCGYEGKCLATAAARTSTVDLVAYADPDTAALRSVAAVGPAVSTYSSVDALLDEAAVDAVLVATPSQALYPVSLAAIRAGKHVLVEKPIGLNAEEAAAAESEAARAGVTYMAGYSCRFSLARHVHDLIAAGLTGEVQAITAQFGCERLDRGWLASPETGGGPLLFLGSHLVDMVLWFAGDDPVEVSAHVRRRDDTGADDTSAFLVQFARGALAQCLVTQAASTFFYTVDVHGRAGRVTLRGWNFLEYEVEVRSTKGPAYADPTVIRPHIDRDHITMMLVPELDEFATAIAEGRPPSITAADGRRVLEVLDAVVTASRVGATVRVG
ncbi:MAG: Gfo/Idh/MocA family oxidoreductase [Actinomycetota bacterium]|jgi:predicted dehydrogenase|nr:Gfo/Idh/MocA family oxidoreductase [Actinomycetota bacterium]